MTQKKSGFDSGTPRPWALAEAQAAVPYLSSLARSLREHYLEMLARRREVQLRRERQGRRDRQALIEEQEARRELHKAEQDYQGALEELSELNVHPVDPGQGVALVPFLQGNQLAWYVFDLFDSPPIRSWRYRSDPEATRRPLTAPQSC
jgi:hypothetical protein